MPDLRRHPDGLDLRWLALASVVETSSLVVLLTNRATVHLPVVTSSVGPLHGFAYLATIAVAFLLPLARRTQLLTVIPVVGGLLALRRARAGRVDDRDPGPDAPDAVPDGDDRAGDQDGRT